jgi:hypothetical protein
MFLECSRIKARSIGFVNRLCVAEPGPLRLLWRIVLRLGARETQEQRGCCGVAALAGSGQGSRIRGGRQCRLASSCVVAFGVPKTIACRLPRGCKL